MSEVHESTEESIVETNSDVVSAGPDEGTAYHGRTPRPAENLETYEGGDGRFNTTDIYH